MHADYKVTENEYELLSFKKTDWYVNTKKTSLMLHFNNLMIKGDDKNINVRRFNNATIKLTGFELANYFSKNWFTFLKLDGAYDGIRAGYMDVFLGAGHHFEMNKKRTNILVKFGLGAGGGGGVDTKGGFLLYPDISLEQKLYNDVFLSINKGFVTSPNAHFYTSSFGVGIKYYIERNGVKTDNSSFTLGQFKGIGVIVKQDLYFNANRDKLPKENLHQISLQLNLYVNENIFIAGQTSFANFGNAGAYAEGIVGIGIKTTPLFHNSTTLFAQFLGGAAGGGNISTGQGLIIKPSLGFDCKISKTLSLRTSGGFVSAIGGQLNSPFINLGIKYNISLLKLK